MNKKLLTLMPARYLIELRNIIFDTNMLFGYVYVYSN